MDAGTAEGQCCVLSPDPKFDPLHNWMGLAGLGYRRCWLCGATPLPASLLAQEGVVGVPPLAWYLPTTVSAT